MTHKEKLIAQILDAAEIHHNISTLSMKLPEAPEGAPADLFYNACAEWIDTFAYEWEHNKRNDSGNRNLCGCRKDKPSNIRTDGACKEHDIYRVYTSGRSRATMYWEKYWKESNRGVYFRYDGSELEEKEIYELETILEDMTAFRDAIKEAKKGFPAMLEGEYDEWKDEQKEEARYEAMGYNKTLREFIASDNPAIVRLAKGIKKEFTK